MNEPQTNKGISDEVIIEIVHSVKEIIILLINNITKQKQIAE